MEKLRLAYHYLSTRNYIHFLLLALLIKGLVADVSYSTVLLTIPILLFQAYQLYIKTKTPDPVILDAELRKELDNLKSKINATNMDKNISAPVKRYF